MEPLTRRQREVAALVAEGLTNRGIADRLIISERTVEGHVDQIRLKLGVRTRSQIVATVLAERPPRRRPGAAPEIRYAKSGDVDIAYQVLGQDGPDLLEFSSAVLPIDSMHEEPALARFQERLASFSRLIRFDLRGVGMSDPIVPGYPPTLEQWSQDALAVLDAVGSTEATVFAPRDASMHAIMMAATYPSRIRALVFYNGTACARRTEDYPWGIPERVIDWFLEVNMQPDATQQGFDYLRMVAPGVADDEGFREWWTRAGNRGASPATSRAIQGVYLRADVRALLPLVQAPVLVFHRRECPNFRVGNGRYLAEHLAAAKYLELPGGEDLYWVADDTATVLDEIEEFVTGARASPASDRVLMTVVLTDIVGSTEHLASIGDRRWSDLLDRHDEVVRRQVDRFRGREVKHTGDGLLATFDGPARAVTCACAIRDAASQLGLEIRAGVHTGEVEVRGDDIGGMAVHIAARVAAMARPREVLMSRTVVDLIVGSGIDTVDRGQHALKGVPGRWRVFAVAG